MKNTVVSQSNQLLPEISPFPIRYPHPVNVPTYLYLLFGGHKINLLIDLIRILTVRLERAYN